MAKGVDLTSKEWRALIFEGKNQEFGAYQMRKKSPKRHMIAIIGILVLLVAVAILVISYNAYDNYKKEQEALAKAAAMTQVDFEQPVEEAPEEEEEVKYEELPEPEEQVEEEQVAAQQVTEIAIVEKPDKDKEVKAMDEIQENQAQIGNVNQEGKIDIGEVQTATKAVTVVEEPKPVVEAPVEKPEPEKIFEAVEQQAQFPGGPGALNKWLSNNLRYPEIPQQNGVQGRVIVQFVVERDGSISNPTVARGVDKDLDKEALRVVRKMPKWQPGKNNGVAVRSRFTLPVVFKLANAT